MQLPIDFSNLSSLKQGKTSLISSLIFFSFDLYYLTQIFVYDFEDKK